MYIDRYVQRTVGKVLTQSNGYQIEKFPGIHEYLKEHIKNILQFTNSYITYIF